MSFQKSVGSSYANHKRKWWLTKSEPDDAIQKTAGSKLEDDKPMTTKKKKTKTQGGSKTFAEALRAKAKFVSAVQIEEKDQWAHLKNCKKKACQTCTFLGMAQKWKPLVCINQKDKPFGSWLGKLKNSDGNVMAGCKVCKKVLETNPNWKCAWSTFNIPVHKLRFTSVKTHMMSKKHQMAMNDIVTQTTTGGSSSSSTSEAAGYIAAAPTLDNFRSVWERAGLAQSKIKRAASGKMMWCISEVLKAKTRRVLENADCIGLIRDERQGRLLIRYRAVKGLDLHCGVLGQAKNFGTGNIL